MDTGLAVALIAGVFGLAGTLLASVLAGKQAGTTRDLARIEEQQRASAEEARHEREQERDARRQYYFQAQVRLYQLYEPLRFQLVQASARALRRISQVSIEPPPTSLSEEQTETASDYLHQTVYDLLCPLALVRLVERQLTLVDLRVDSRIGFEFCLAKSLHDAMSDDVLLARIAPSVPYSPYVEDWRARRVNDPQQYRRQGLNPGELETVLGLFVGSTPSGTERLLSSGEFMTQVRQVPPPQGVEELQRLFDGFTPKERPVLWRILVTQALLYGCFLTVAMIEPPTREAAPRLGDDHALLLGQAAARGQRLDLDWKEPIEGCTDVAPEAVAAALPAAAEYYRRRVAPASLLTFGGSGPDRASADVPAGTPSRSPT